MTKLTLAPETPKPSIAPVPVDGSEKNDTDKTVTPGIKPSDITVPAK